METKSFRSIAIIVNSLAGGGAEKVALALSERALNLDRRVTLILFDHSGELLPSVPSGVNLIALPRIAKLLRGPGIVLALAYLLRRICPEIILCMGEWPNILVPPARFLARMKMPLVISERNEINPAACDSKGEVRELAKWSYRAADGLLSVSTVAEVAALRICGPKWKGYRFVTGNPVAVDQVVALSKEALPTADGRWPRSFVLAIGRLEKQKNFPMLIEAFSMAFPRIGIDLIILGRGAEMENLRKISINCGIEERVFFPGFVTNPWAWISRCKVLAMSSDYEGLSNSLIEAMVLGANIVSTTADNGALESGKWGRLVAVGDLESFREALSDAIQGFPPSDLQDYAKERYAKLTVLNKYIGYLDHIFCKER